MKWLKLMVLTVVAVGLMAATAVSTASATELTCGASMCAAETTVKGESEGKVVLDAPFGNVECNSTFEGATQNTGGASITIKITIPISFSNCGGDTVISLSHITWELHVRLLPPRITSTWSGWRFTVIHLGVHCIYEASETDIGTLTASSETGGNATLDVSGTIPRVGGEGGAFCGSSAPLTGSFKITNPNPLNVD